MPFAFDPFPLICGYACSLWNTSASDSGLARNRNDKTVKRGARTRKIENRKCHVSSPSHDVSPAQPHAHHRPMRLAARPAGVLLARPCIRRGLRRPPAQSTSCAIAPPRQQIQFQDYAERSGADRGAEPSVGDASPRGQARPQHVGVSKGAQEEKEDAEEFSEENVSCSVIIRQVHLYSSLQLEGGRSADNLLCFGRELVAGRTDSGWMHCC